MVEDIVELREIDLVIAIGMQEPERIFEVMARKGALDERLQQLRARYQAALSSYRRRDWDAARTAFAAALDIMPLDGPSQTLLARIDGWASNPPPPDWVGVWRLTEK